MPTTSSVVNSWILNPDLVAAHAQERVEKPKVTPDILRVLHGLKPGVPVGEDQHALIMKGVNADVHAGHVNLKGTKYWVPVLVKVKMEDPPQAAAPKQTVPPPEVGKPKSFAAMQKAISDGERMHFERPDDQGRTPCIVMTNANPNLCVCGGWHDPSEMLAVRVKGGKACLPVGKACAEKMRKLIYEKNFAQVLAEVLGLKNPTAPKKLASPPSTLADFVAALKKDARLQFSKEIVGRDGFFPCTLAINGKGLCDCEAHARNSYALNYNEHVFPVCLACAGKLRLLDPKLDITRTSFAQALGWREDLFPVGEYDPNHKKDDVRAGVYIDANGGVSLAKKPKVPQNEKLTDDELKRREAANAARRAEHRANRHARSAAAANKPTTPPNPKGGGKKSKGGNRKK